MECCFVRWHGVDKIREVLKLDLRSKAGGQIKYLRQIENLRQAVSLKDRRSGYSIYAFRKAPRWSGYLSEP